MALIILSIGLSAFLLFLVEPMIGKTLLPWFGGSAAVWSTVMLYFQVILTGGYAYAAWLGNQTRRMGRLHVILLGLSVLIMLGLGLFWRSPITPTLALHPTEAIPPALDIFLLLTITVGLPFFLLSANSTLVQAWSVRRFPKQTPYKLYALSNLSALMALIFYPFLLEPNLSIPSQGWSWSLGYLLFAVLAGLITFQAMHVAQKDGKTTPDQGTARLFTKSVPEPTENKSSDLQEAKSRNHPSRYSHSPSGLRTEIPSTRPAMTRSYLLWAALSACASAFFLSTTSYLTQQVAVIPFLWVLPLAIYLLTFVLAFSGDLWYARQVYIWLILPVILLYEWAMANGARLGILSQVVIFSLVLFVGCMVCNGELYRRRPDPSHLPIYYLLISAGGAIGGILVAFGAPALFRGYWEYPLSVLLYSILFLIIGRRQKGEGIKAELLATLGTTFLAVTVLITGLRAAIFIGSDLTGAILSQRNFYGVVRIRQVGTPGQADFSYLLINGNTIHGAQFPEASKRDIPTFYYGPTSGVGLALLNQTRTDSGLRVGALGLGTGTIASYGQPKDVYTFYEINPLIIQLAQGQGGYFSFLQDSKAAIQIIPGDARLSLENELASDRVQQYDVLVLDVFSNDAIPVHLLDKQAFALYLQFLQPDGILAVHITNGYLDLVPVVWSLADHFNLARAVIEGPGDGVITSASTWMLLSRAASVLGMPAIVSRAKPMQGYTTSLRLWTDEYSNLFQILKH